MVFDKLLYRTMNLSKKNIYQECGNRFSQSLITGWIGKITKLVICVDPAPTPTTVFKMLTKSVCPKCKSHKVKIST